jgi:hypothetical protein
MKKVLITSILSLTAVVAFGQGTVFFANDSATLTSPPDRLIRFASNLAPATGTNIQVQLYFGAAASAEGALVPVTSAPARLRAATTTIPGTWSAGGDRTLGNFGFGTAVTLQVRAWDINFGSTYEAAAANPANTGLIGKSALFAYQIPATPADPVANFFMSNFQSFTVAQIPEPSTFALAGLGAAALVIFRRRK